MLEAWFSIYEYHAKNNPVEHSYSHHHERKALNNIGTLILIGAQIA